MTFSNQSKFHSDKTPGGEWKKADDNVWEFYPSQHNISNAGGLEKYKLWFNQYEKGSRLREPAVTQ